MEQVVLKKTTFAKMDTLVFIIKWGVMAYVIYSIGKSAFQESSRSFTLSVVKQFRFGMLLEVLLGIAIMIAVSVLLYQIPFLQWGWTQLIFDKPVNIVAAPTNTGSSALDKWIGIPFLLLLVVAIPKLAHSEEKAFRSKVTDFGGIVLNSIEFGLIHCIVGVPLAVGLGLGIGGLLFAIKYRKRFLGQLNEMGIQKRTDGTYSYTMEYTLKMIREVPLITFIKTDEDKVQEAVNKADKTALLYSTAYHTMWNYIIAAILLSIVVLS